MMYETYIIWSVLRPARGIGVPQRAADLREDRTSFPSHGKVHEGDASREGSLDITGRSHGQPRLADATWSRDRQEPHIGVDQSPRKPGPLRSPAEECRRLRW